MPTVAKLIGHVCTEETLVRNDSYTVHDVLPASV